MEELLHFLDYNTQINVLADVVLAIILGGIIGGEREIKGKPAGMRTNMIIAGAATVCIAMGRTIMVDYSYLISTESLGADPTRILHAVIVGVGFMGAGVILKSKEGTEVHYLTTAATIWMSAALGVVIGLHQYILAIGITIIMLIVNVAVNQFEKRYLDKYN